MKCNASYGIGKAKFFNITNGNEIIGRMTPPVNNLTLTHTTLVGNYQASSTITAETNVVVNGTATLKTPGTLYLKPGFTANSGCNLTISVGAVTSDKYYYLKDHLGSIRVVVDTVGEIVSYDDYDPYGMQLAGRSANYGYANDKYKFSSKERDFETGYDYFGSRYYESRFGRWLQPDPLAEKYPGWSPFNYTMNNPMKFIDPNGKEIKIYDQKSGKYFNYTYGMSTSRFDKNMGAFVSNLNSIYDKSDIGKKLISYFVGNKNEDWVVQMGTGTQSFTRGNKTSFIGADQSAVVTTAHEMFHAYQYFKGDEGPSIANETEAYIFGGRVDWDVSGQPPTEGSKSDIGTQWQTKYKSLMQKFDISNFNFLIDYFFDGHRSGNYYKSRKLDSKKENDKTTITDFIN